MSFAFRLAGLYAAIFMLNGIQLPFLPLWLEAKGLDARQIGFVLAVPLVVRVLIVPPVTRFADRYDALRGVILAAALVSVTGYLLLGLSAGFAAILLAFTFASLAYTPMMPLVETYALSGLAAHRRNYGPVRLWGSAAFILGALLAGIASDVMPARHLIWLLFACVLLVALSASLLMPLTRAAHAMSSTSAPPRLLRDPVFVAVVVGASLVQASHAVYYGFSILAWRAQGYDGVAIAALWAIGVVAEIVLFALQSRLPAFLTPTALLLAGALGGVVRWTAMAFDPPMLLVPWLQVLHAATFGATHLGAVMFLSRTVPVEQGATAQGYLSISMGLTMAAATGLSGQLFATFGTAAYAAMALAAVAGGAGAVVAHRARRVAAL